MNRLSRTFIFLCAGSVLFVFVLIGPFSAIFAESHRAIEKRTEFGTGLETAYGLHEVGDGNCILFRVFFISRDFFSRIERVESTGGLLIKKGTKVFRTFPETLIVNVEADVHRCKGKTATRLPLASESELLEPITFKLSWKREFEMRPTGLASVQIRQPVDTVLGNRWEYYLSVPAAEVPLSDHLLIDLVKKNGDTLIRVSAKL
jgi:hypothetical protein